jgi:hypothetical protein
MTHSEEPDEEETGMRGTKKTNGSDVRWRPLHALVGSVLLILLAGACSGAAEPIASEPADAEAAAEEAPSPSPEPSPSPAVEEARVEGEWKIRGRFESVVGYDEPAVGDTVRRTWVATPRCEEGACGLRLEREVEDGVSRERVALDDGAYSYEGTFESECQGHEATVTFRYEFTVTDADWIDGEWKAIAFEGTFEDTYVPTPAAAADGCIEASKSASITGRLES